MTRLADLLQHVGADLLEVTSAPRGLDRAVAGVRVLDLVDEPLAARDELVLGAGVRLDGGAVDVLRRLGAAGAAGLIVHGGGPVDQLIVDASEAAAVALLRIPPGVPWVDLLQLVLQALRLGGDEPHSRFAHEAPQDLSVIANELAELVDAPVLIQDVNTTVLAYSRRQEEADAARALTIVSRRIPEHIMRELRATGRLAQMNASQEPVYFEQPAEGVGPRLVVAVRAGDDVIGYVWAAIKRPPTPEQIRLLGQGASLVSLHVLRQHLTLDLRRSFQSELVAAALRGGPVGQDAATRLGLPQSAYRIVAISVAGSSDETDPAVIHCLDIASFHLRPLHPRVALGLLGATLYALIPVATSKVGTAALRQNLADLLRRANASIPRGVLVALSGAVAGVAELPAARREVDEILRVLRVRPELPQPAQIDDVQLDGLILRIVDYCRTEPALSRGPLQALEEHDAAHRTAYVDTLRAYLQRAGDVNAAAVQLGIHANTMRYRLKQLQSIARIDLRNPDHLLVASLLVRASIP